MARDGRGATAVARWAPILALALIAIPMVVWGAGQRIVVLDGQKAGVAGNPLTADGRFLGLVGDYFSLPSGRHTLRFEDALGRALSITVAIRQSGLDVAQLVHAPATICDAKPHRVWRLVAWPRPEVRSDPSFPGALKVVLAAPSFEATKLETSCASSSVACVQRHATVSVSTTPEGAEIWIDAKASGLRTNVKNLSVPYCDYETSKRVTLRKDRYVNCVTQISLPAAQPLAVTCDLVGPAK